VSIRTRPAWDVKGCERTRTGQSSQFPDVRRGITPSTAVRLAKAFSTSPQFWLNGQLALDLYKASHDQQELRELERIEPLSR
jgi:antitoxin HigA-1